MQHLRTTLRSSQVTARSHWSRRNDDGGQATGDAVDDVVDDLEAGGSFGGEDRVDEAGLLGQATRQPAKRHVVQELVDRLGRQHGAELKQIAFAAGSVGLLPAQA